MSLATWHKLGLPYAGESARDSESALESESARGRVRVRHAKLAYRACRACRAIVRAAAIDLGHAVGLTVIAASVVLTHCIDAAAADIVPPLTGEPPGAHLPAWLSRVGEAVQSAYHRTPALVLGLASMLGVLMLAALGGLMRRASLLGLEGGGVGAGTESDERTSRTGFASPRKAVVEHVTCAGSPTTLRARLTRIGSADDNDIVIGGEGVLRYHAAVERTSEMDYFVVDLGGSDTARVRINGDTVSRRRLRDGDAISVGAARLKFRLLSR